MNTSDTTPTYWKKCSSCKKEIPFRAPYYTCSVSTCQGERTGYSFCSVACWDSHLGFARHREAYAIEQTAPSQTESVAAESPVRRLVRPHQTESNPREIKTDTLVVVSKVKQLVREQSDFNMSGCAIDALTTKVIRACLKGIEHARSSGRKTVMGRDILE